MNTYSEDMISDLHKDAYGFRPSNRFWMDWEGYSEAEKQECWDIMNKDLMFSIEEDERLARESVLSFEANVQKHMELGANTRADALRWMTQNEKFYHQQSVEHWVWNLGILFTNEGRALVKELMGIVKFEEWEYA